MYEISYLEEGQAFPTLECFDSFEEAVERAEEFGVDVIFNTEGFDEYVKCEFCGEWVTPNELDIDGYCEHCVQAIRSRGEEI